MFATTRSNTIKGINIIKPISNEVLSSLMIYAGATSQRVNSSGVSGTDFLVFSKRLNLPALSVLT